MMKKAILAIAVLFSATAFAQNHADERDLENRKAPYNETSTKTKTETKSHNLSKGDADYRDMGSTATVGTTSLSEKNRICCGKEKDNGFLGTWKMTLNNRVKQEKRDAAALNTETTTKSKTKTSTEVRSDLYNSDANTGVDMNGEDKDLKVGTGISTETELNNDTRMDAGSRSNLDMDLNNSDSEMEMNLEDQSKDQLKDSGSRCPSNDHDMNHDMEKKDSGGQLMDEETSPKY
jgi:hypothetical protein